MSKPLTFQSAERRNLAYSALLGVIPNALIAAAVVYFIKPYDYIFTFFLVLVGIWVLEMLIWLRNAIWSWLYFRLYGKKIRSDTLLAYLNQEQFPQPEGRFSNPEEYFLSVANNPSATIEHRMAALALAVRRRSYGEQGKLTQAIQNAIADEDAISRYAATFNRPV